MTAPVPRWLVDAGVVGLGGFTGSVLRYWVSGWVYGLSAAPREIVDTREKIEAFLPVVTPHSPTG